MASQQSTYAGGPPKSGAGDKIKGAIGAVHVRLQVPRSSPMQERSFHMLAVLTHVQGAGEAIRGTANQAVDEAFGDRQGAAKNQAVAERGFEAVDDGKLRRADHEEAKLGRKTNMDVSHTSKHI
jgi:hypothetical protein